MLTPVACKRHDMVRFRTRKFGDIWICLRCHKCNKETTLTPEEIEALVMFAIELRDREPEQ